MKGPGKGQGKPGRGKGKGKGKGKDKGKGKGSGAGVGSTYANPGRPKSFQPTQQDRQRTGKSGRVSRLPVARKTANLCSRKRSLSMCAGICSTWMGTLSPASPRRGWTQGGLPCTFRLYWRRGGRRSRRRGRDLMNSRLRAVCDNASVHKTDELKKLMDQYGIILRFLPPNMTQWLQPLDRVVCGLIKIVQRARRGRLGLCNYVDHNDSKNRNR